MEHILVLLLVGLVAGFLATHLMAGHGFGVIGDIVVGVVGALVGSFLAGLLGIAATSLIAEIIIAFIGACLLIAVFRMATMRRGYGRRRML